MSASERNTWPESIYDPMFPAKEPSPFSQKARYSPEVNEKLTAIVDRFVEKVVAGRTVVVKP